MEQEERLRKIGNEVTELHIRFDHFRVGMKKPEGSVLHRQEQSC